MANDSRMSYDRLMANCYVCGRPIEDSLQLRRRVKTGGYERKRFPGSRANLVQTHFGMRIVCKRCARGIDWKADRDRVRGHLLVLAAIALLVAIVLIAH